MTNTPSCNTNILLSNVPTLSLGSTAINNRILGIISKKTPCHKRKNFNIISMFLNIFPKHHLFLSPFFYYYFLRVVGMFIWKFIYVFIYYYFICFFIVSTATIFSNKNNMKIVPHYAWVHTTPTERGYEPIL